MRWVGALSNIGRAYFRCISALPLPGNNFGVLGYKEKFVVQIPPRDSIDTQTGLSRFCKEDEGPDGEFCKGVLHIVHMVFPYPPSAPCALQTSGHYFSRISTYPLVLAISLLTLVISFPPLARCLLLGALSGLA